MAWHAGIVQASSEIGAALLEQLVVCRSRPAADGEDEDGEELTEPEDYITTRNLIPRELCHTLTISP